MSGIERQRERAEKLRTWIAEASRRGLTDTQEFSEAQRRLKSAEDSISFAEGVAEKRKTLQEGGFLPRPGDTDEWEIYRDAQVAHRDSGGMLPGPDALKRFGDDVYDTSPVIPSNRSRGKRIEEEHGGIVAALASPLLNIGDAVVGGLDSITGGNATDAAGYIYDTAESAVLGHDRPYTEGQDGAKMADRARDYSYGVWEHGSPAAKAGQILANLGGIGAGVGAGAKAVSAVPGLRALMGGRKGAQITGGALGGLASAQWVAQGDANWDQEEAERILDTDMGAMFGTETGIPLRYGSGALGAAVPGAIFGAGAIGRAMRETPAAGPSIPDAPSRARRKALRMVAEDLGDDVGKLQDNRAPEFRVADINQATQRRAGAAARRGSGRAAEFSESMRNREASRTPRMLGTLADELQTPEGMAGDVIGQSRAYAGDLMTRRRKLAGERGYSGIEGLRISDDVVPESYAPASRGLPDDYTYRDAARDLVDQAAGMGLRSKADRLQIGMTGRKADAALREIPSDVGRGRLDRYKTSELKALMRNRGLHTSVNRDASLGPVTDSLTREDMLKILRKVRENDAARGGLPQENNPPVAAEDIRALKTAANDEAQRLRLDAPAEAKAFGDFADRARAILAEGVKNRAGQRKSMIGDEYHAALSRAIEAFELSSGVRARAGGKTGKGGLFTKTPEELERFVENLDDIRGRIARDTRLSTGTRKNLVAEFDKAYEAYRVGAVRSYADFLQQNPVSKGARVFNDDNLQMRARLRTLFDSDEAMERYLRSVDDEGAMQTTEREVLYGSQTAARQAADEGLEVGGRDTFFTALTRGGIRGLAGHLVNEVASWASDRVLRGLTTRIADELADILDETDLSAIAREMEDARVVGRDIDVDNLPETTAAKAREVAEDAADEVRQSRPLEERVGDMSAPQLRDRLRVLGEELKQMQPGRAKNNRISEAAAIRRRLQEIKDSKGPAKPRTDWKGAATRLKGEVGRLTGENQRFFDSANSARRRLARTDQQLDEQRAQTGEAIEEVARLKRGRWEDSQKVEREGRSVRAEGQRVKRRLDELSDLLPAQFARSMELRAQSILDEFTAASERFTAMGGKDGALSAWMQSYAQMRALIKEYSGALRGTDVPVEFREDFARFEMAVNKEIADRLGSGARVEITGGLDNAPAGSFQPSSWNFRFTRAVQFADDLVQKGAEPITLRRAIIDEEIAHAFDELGVFSRGERAALIAAGKRYFNRLKQQGGDDVMAPYEGEGLSKADMERELLAKFLARGGLKEVPQPLIQRIWQRIKELLGGGKDVRASRVAREFRSGGRDARARALFRQNAQTLSAPEF